MRGLQASADNELRSEYVMPGEASFSIASISVAYPAQSATPMFETSNLTVRSDVDLDAAGELLEMRVNYDVDSVRLEENELTAGSLALTVRNLDVAAVEAYSAAASDAAAAGADPSTFAGIARPTPRTRAQGRPEPDARPVPLPLRRRALRWPHRGHDESGAPAAGRHA